MATVILDTRYSEAKRLLEQLKKVQYAKIIDTNTYNEKTRRAIDELENGEGGKAHSAANLFNSI
ncbi:MAG: hypothetical protein K9H26_08475 [Prolixibacteraceae bacterium]|nr:hypothetical protein [Prolixibacteraceae bacterium]